MKPEISDWRCPHIAFLLVVLMILPASQVFGQDAIPTRVMVRAVSQDAKVLHDGVGGARITIRDAATGKELASGVQKGSSGDTDKIMRLPRKRGEAVYDTPGTAGFVANLPLTKPTNVEIIAEGPLAFPHAVKRVSTSMLLVPGQDVLGEGILLNLHGFIVDIQMPENDSSMKESVPVRAKVTMMCGCPTEPDGLWDADEIDIKARLLRDGVIVSETPLAYAGETSTYEGLLPVPGPGDGSVVLQVLAIDASRGNFGMHERLLNP